MSQFLVLGLCGDFCFMFAVFYIEIPVNSVDTDQTPHSAASEVGLHCWRMSRKRGSSLERVVR